LNICGWPRIVQLNNHTKMKFYYENTKHKLGMQIWGDRGSFYELHELLSRCWDCADDVMSRAENCSYIGVVAYFCYTVRHAFMGDRLVKLDGKSINIWGDEMILLFEKEQKRFEVGVEFSWPQMLFIMASWWECLRRRECPAALLPVMREFAENIERLLQQRSKLQYPKLEPYVRGAIYAANPYLMHTMEHINIDYLQRTKMCKPSLDWLAEKMECSSFGTWQYEGYMATLRKYAKKLGCQVEDLEESVDEAVYDIEL